MALPMLPSAEALAKIGNDAEKHGEQRLSKNPFPPLFPCFNTTPM